MLPQVSVNLREFYYGIYFTVGATAVQERRRDPAKEPLPPPPYGERKNVDAQENVPFCPWRQKGTERTPPKGSRPLETCLAFMFLFDGRNKRRRFAIFAPQTPAETNISKRRQTQPKADARP